MLTISPPVFFESRLYLRRMRSSADVNVLFSLFSFEGNKRRLQSSALAASVFALRFAALTSLAREIKWYFFSAVPEEFVHCSHQFFHSMRFLKPTLKTG